MEKQAHHTLASRRVALLGAFVSFGSSVDGNRNTSAEGCYYVVLPFTACVLHFLFDILPLLFSGVILMQPANKDEPFTIVRSLQGSKYQRHYSPLSPAAETCLSYPAILECQDLHRIPVQWTSYQFILDLSICFAIPRSVVCRSSAPFEALEETPVGTATTKHSQTQRSCYQL